MKVFKISILIIVTSLSATLSITAKKGAAKPDCERDNNLEEPASTTRNLKLEKFGIAVKIPNNYRAMKQQDGSVAILNPDTYKWLQCLEQRGERHNHGYYSEKIKLVKDELTMNLRKQALNSEGYRIKKSGDHNPVTQNIVTYENQSISGYVVTSISGTSVTFLGTIPNSSKLLKVSAVCDCNVKAEDVIELLNGITLLNHRNNSEEKFGNDQQPDGRSLNIPDASQSSNQNNNTQNKDFVRLHANDPESRIFVRS